MSNADHYPPLGLPLTLVMARNAFQVDPKKHLGRQSAGASFLEAYLRYSGNTRHTLVVPNKAERDWFHTQALAFHDHARTEAVGFNQWGDIGTKTGAVHVPDPGINHWAWKRMPWGDGSYSIIGIVHTLCSHSVQQSLGQYTSAPVRSWDALICTSRAARSVVEGFFERQETWLRNHNEACRFERPQLPIIPLGIHPDNWAPPVSKAASCRAARAKLGLQQEAQVVLLAGRLDLMTKFQPGPLFQSLANLKETKHPKLEVLIYGEAPTPEMERLWHRAVAQLAPQLTVHWVPGKDASLAATVRWAADVFISLSDNPQETFGITPLEAMAAELPCLVSDWNGYKESVIQPGEAGHPTGLRVTTRLIKGLGASEAHMMLQESIDFGFAVGRISQGVAVDLEQFQHHLSTLLSRPELRQAMGAAGRQRVQSIYDWKVVMEQWRHLVRDLNERRCHARASQQTTPPQLPPWMPDTSIAFGHFASEILPASWNPTPPSAELEAKHLSNPFQDWDEALLKQIDARRKGWWLKQGLIEH